MGDDARTCQDCGAENAPHARFCSQCAKPLETTQQQEIDALEMAATTESIDGAPSEAEGSAKEAASEKTEAEEAAPVAPVVPSASFTVSRKKALIGGGAVLTLIAGVAVALAVTLSGASTGTTRASATSEPQTDSGRAQTNPVNTEDTDGDGTPDASDSDPYSANTSPDDTSTDEFDSAPSADDEDDDSYLDDAEEETSHTAVSIGEPATDDDVTFKVLSLEPVSSIPTDEFSGGPITAKKGAKLVKAVVRWKNNMSKSASIFCGEGSAILLDQDSRNFDPIDDQIDIAGSNVCDDVQPGFTQTVTLAFQMPKDSNTTELVLWNSDADDDFDGKQTDVRVAK